MTIQARELQRLGVECEFFFTAKRMRFEEVAEIAPTTVGSLAGFLRQVEGGGFDVVHLENSDFLADIAAVARTRARVIVTSHADLAASRRGECFAATAVSPHLARMNQALCDLEVESIPNGVDLDRFRPPQARGRGKPILGWVGRTRDTAIKDFPRFTRIAALLGDGFRVRVADADSGSWDHLLGTDHRRIDIDSWGHVDYAGMPEFYRAIAESGGLLLVTSRYEGGPLVAMEAAACGAATFALQVGNLSNCVVAEVTGRLFDPSTPDEEIAAAIRRWVSERAGGHETLEACAAVAAERFSSAAMTRRYLETYTRAGQLAYGGPALRIDPAIPGMGILLRRYREAAWNRAAELRKAAAELAAEGHRTAAMAALRRAFRLRPKSFFHPRSAMQTGRTLLSAYSRPDRGVPAL